MENHPRHQLRSPSSGQVAKQCGAKRFLEITKAPIFRISIQPLRKM
jgi:hypothetical protein